MFERYTEKARRVIFFARYEASQFGSRYIETEQILLGLIREDKGLAMRAIPHFDAESIREEIENGITTRDKISTSVDLPLTNESKRVLYYADEEADRLGSRHIGTEHLLLGLLREENCFAARILRQRGVVLESLRSNLGESASGTTASFSLVEPSERRTRDPGLLPQARGALRRPIVFLNDAGDKQLGDAFSIDAPRVGDEITVENTQGSVTRISYHYRKADVEIDGRIVSWAPEKVVVYVRVLNK